MGCDGWMGWDCEWDGMEWGGSLDGMGLPVGLKAKPKYDVSDRKWWIGYFVQ